MIEKGKTSSFLTLHILCVNSMTSYVNKICDCGPHPVHMTRPGQCLLILLTEIFQQTQHQQTSTTFVWSYKIPEHFLTNQYIQWITRLPWELRSCGNKPQNNMKMCCKLAWGKVLRFPRYFLLLRNLWSYFFALLSQILSLTLLSMLQIFHIFVYFQFTYISFTPYHLLQNLSFNFNKNFVESLVSIKFIFNTHPLQPPIAHRKTLEVISKLTRP